MKLMIAFLMLLTVSNAYSQAISVATPGSTTTTVGTTGPAPTSEGTTATTTPSTTSTDLSFWEKVKKAPVSLFVDNDLSASNSNGKLVGFNNVSTMYFTYKLTTKQSLRVSSGYSLSDDNTSNPKGAYQGTTLMYRRSALLTSDKHGVDLRSEIRLNFAPSNPNTVGSTSFRVGASKEFNPKFSLYSELRWNEYGRKSSTPGLTRRSFVLLAIPGFNFNDKLSFAGTTLFTQAEKGNGANDSNDLNFAPAVSYTFTDKLSGSVYWDTYPLASNDGHFFTPNWVSNSGLGLYFSYVIL